ncbi:FUSC family protein, partial [Vibrio diabolicus]
GLPLTGSYHLKEHRKLWHQRLEEMKRIQERLLEQVEKPHCDDIDWKPVAQNLTLFDIAQPTTHLIGRTLLSEQVKQKTSWHREHRTFIQHLKEDRRKVLQGLSMFITSLLVWIYLPVPGGFIFPMLAGV